MPPRRAGPTTLVVALLLAGALATMAVWVARPLVSHLGQALPLGADARAGSTLAAGVRSDSFQLYYQLWLVRDGLFGPTPPFRDPYQFRIAEPRANALQTFPPLSLPFALLAPLDPVAAYGVLALLTFPATGLLAGALVLALTGSALAAAVAGAGLAVLPVRLTGLFGGHPAGFVLALLPAAVAGLDRAVTRGSRRGGLLGGLALFGLATAEPQYTYLGAPLLAVHGALRWRHPPAPPPGRPLALALFAAGAVAGVAWLWLFRQHLVAESVLAAGRGLEEVRTLAPGLGALARPATWGGLGLGLLALAGLAGAWRGEGRGVRLAYGGWLALGAILAAGPGLPGLPLYETLHAGLPIFGLIRNPAKLHVLTALGLVVLAGYGARDLLERLPPRARGLAGAALAAAVVAAAVPWHGIRLARLPEPPVLDAVRAEARKVLYLPLWPGDSSQSSPYLLYLTRTRVPALNGYSPVVPRRYVAEVFEPLRGLNLGQLGPPEHAVLRRLGVSHLVVDGLFFSPEASPFPPGLTARRLAASGGVTRLSAAPPYWLFRVEAALPAVPAAVSSPLGVFFEAEALSRQTGRVGAEPEASGGRVVVAGPGGRAGFLAYGPHQVLPPGAFRATYRVRGSGLRVDVSAEVGREVIARQAIPDGPGWRVVTLPFRIERSRPLEFRVEWSGAGQAAVDWVLVTCADRPDPEWTYEVEDFWALAGDREDPAASGGRALHVEASPDRGDVARGPARLFPAGRYRATLWARAEEPGAGRRLLVRLAEPRGRTLTSRAVDAAEIPPGAYRPISLDFQVGDERVLEVGLRPFGPAGLLLDRLDIQRLGDPPAPRP